MDGSLTSFFQQHKAIPVVLTGLITLAVPLLSWKHEAKERLARYGELLELTGKLYYEVGSDNRAAFHKNADTLRDHMNAGHFDDLLPRDGSAYRRFDNLITEAQDELDAYRVYCEDKGPSSEDSTSCDYQAAPYLKPAFSILYLGLRSIWVFGPSPTLISSLCALGSLGATGQFLTRTRLC